MCTSAVWFRATYMIAIQCSVRLHAVVAGIYESQKTFCSNVGQTSRAVLYTGLVAAFNRGAAREPKAGVVVGLLGHDMPGWVGECLLCRGPWGWGGRLPQRTGSPVI